MLEEMHASGGESWEELVRLAVGLSTRRPSTRRPEQSADKSQSTGFSNPEELEPPEKHKGNAVVCSVIACSAVVLQYEHTW